MEKLFRRYDILLIIMLFLMVVPAERAELFSLAEDQTLSFRHLMRMSYGDVQANRASPDIVLVNTDEAFFKAYGSFPLRRTDIGRIVENLATLGARIVAIDVLMDFPSSYGEDPVLAGALRRSGNTLLVAQADIKDGRARKVNLPTKTLDDASPSAYTNISSTSALVTTLSRLKLYPEVSNQRGGWPFAVKVASMYLGAEPRLDGSTLSIGSVTIPLDHENTFYIDFPPLPTGTRFLFQSQGLSALEFLDLDSKDENERMELSFWVKDKIVLLGDTSEVSHDWFDTPVGMVYGIEIIADTLNTILRGAPLRPLSHTVEALIAMVMMGLLIGIAVLANPVLRIVAFLGLFAVYFAGGTALYVHQGVVLSMSYILLAGLMGYILIEYYHFMLVRNQKKQIAKTFGQYIPTELVEEMNKSGKSVEVGGESREMTVLFSDVRGFTTLSEGLAPQELTQLMNAFLSPMTKTIHKHRGTIDKYMGDAIMAFWGAPLEDKDHARHATEAALAMIGSLDEVNRSFEARGWKAIKIGVGLNTGVMNVGNMGSDFRLAYTVLGDAVNLGSRLEGLTKQYGVLVIVNETTAAAVPDLVVRQLDAVRVKGKDQPVTIFEPVGFREAVDATTLANLDRYHEALTLYRAQKWAEARAAFEALHTDEPERKIHHIYLERIEHFVENPPGADWDGVFTHTSK
ncbi:MAG: adenylate/guanylate cyclase domain-containing protein [Alphaproteobacteria bacterium]